MIIVCEYENISEKSLKKYINVEETDKCSGLSVIEL